VAEVSGAYKPVYLLSTRSSHPTSAPAMARPLIAHCRSVAIPPIDLRMKQPVSVRVLGFAD
jgi:hypothetical protein